MKLANKYTIKVHSFVDLITNSSTELYISATNHTRDAVIKMVDAVLELGNSNFKCDDLFEITLNKVEDSWTDEVNLVVKAKDENSEAGKTAEKVLCNLTGLFSIDAEYNG